MGEHHSILYGPVNRLLIRLLGEPPVGRMSSGQAAFWFPDGREAWIPDSALMGLLVLFLLLSGFRFIILSTAYIIPSYLQTIQNYRGLDVGAVLLWIALPQIVLVLPLALLLQRIDPRWTLGAGASLIAAAR